MRERTGQKRVLRLLGEVLDYPTAQLPEQARECAELLAGPLPEVVEYLEGFRSFVERTPVGRIEEVYTGFFDLNPVCHPYVGYHLFGETYKRSSFLLGLKERYRAQGFSSDERELPDRLSVVLRFLSDSADEELNSEVVEEAVIPALERMTGEKRRPEAVSDDAGPQLQGHSQGEVLDGGFVLEMTAPSEGRHPYWRILRALLMVLRSTRTADTPAAPVSPSGGKADG